MYRLVCLAACIGLISCDQDVYNTTAAATNIESTLGTPAILVDPTSISNQNTTDTVLEVGIFVCSFFLVMLWGWQLTRKKNHFCLFVRSDYSQNNTAFEQYKRAGWNNYCHNNDKSSCVRFWYWFNSLDRANADKEHDRSSRSDELFPIPSNNFILIASLIGSFIIQSKVAYRVVCGTVYSAWRKLTKL